MDDLNLHSKLFFL